MNRDTQSRGQTVSLVLMSRWSRLWTGWLKTYSSWKWPSLFVISPLHCLKLAEWCQRFACLYSGCNIAVFCQASAPNVFLFSWAAQNDPLYKIRKLKYYDRKTQWLGSNAERLFVRLTIVRWTHIVFWFVALYCIKVSDREVNNKFPELTRCRLWSWNFLVTLFY